MNEEIINICASYLGTNYETLKIKSRCNQLVTQRAYVFFVLRHVLALPQKSIGRLFSVDHTTVLYHLQKLDDFVRINSREDEERVPYYFRNQNRILNKLMEITENKLLELAR